MTTEFGRGAWSTVGGASPYYELITPNVGSQAVKDATLDPHSFDYRAVTHGVKAIQTRLNEMGYPHPLVVDGWFGSATKAGVEWAQTKLNLVSGYTAGRVGSTLAKAMFRPIVVSNENSHNIPGHHLGGIMMHESGGDPGAVGYYTHWDKGLFQFNCDPSWSPPYTIDQAFDYHWSVKTAAKRLSDARSEYSGKGAYLQDHCSIAQHNSPLWADQWYKNGTPPNQTISDYVFAVLDLAKSF
jgi:hypothetical protein